MFQLINIHPTNSVKMISYNFICKKTVNKNTNVLAIFILFIFTIFSWLYFQVFSYRILTMLLKPMVATNRPPKSTPRWSKIGFQHGFFYCFLFYNFLLLKDPILGPQTRPKIVPKWCKN